MTTSSALSWTIDGRLASSSANGTCLEPSMWPASKSAASRTSIVRCFFPGRSSALNSLQEMAGRPFSLVISFFQFVFEFFLDLLHFLGDLLGGFLRLLGHFFLVPFEVRDERLHARRDHAE